MNLYSTSYLFGVVNSLVTTPQWFLNRYFPVVQTETAKEIHFDIIDKTRRIAPFVSPVLAGKVVNSKGFRTATFEPAYVKDKRVFDADRPLKRSAGEQIGGSLSPEQRIQAILGYELIDQMEMIDRRLEVMAAEVLRTGAVTITGEDYPTVNVDFGRNSDLSVTLTGTSKWGSASAKPLNDLKTWSLKMLKTSGAMATDVVMDVDTWIVFSASSDVKALLDRFRGSSTLVENTQIGEGGVFMGVINGLNIFTYSGWYIDPADKTETEKPMIPPGTVMLLTEQIQGVRAFAAIKDRKAGYQAMPYFPKMWEEDDPSVLYMMMQSAPLIVPTRVNASFCATVM